MILEFPKDTATDVVIRDNPNAILTVIGKEADWEISMVDFSIYSRSVDFSYSVYGSQFNRIEI